mmetsp:Transcript_56116/g.87375  ORF Transcript_56116/g.87375 Transcript_56116/m.87375 type:complete len:239 (-) Transcript_56116:111-827(-)
MGMCHKVLLSKALRTRIYLWHHCTCRGHCNRGYKPASNAFSNELCQPIFEGCRQAEKLLSPVLKHDSMRLGQVTLVFFQISNRRDQFLRLEYQWRRCPAQEPLTPTFRNAGPANHFHIDTCLRCRSHGFRSCLDMLRPSMWVQKSLRDKCKHPPHIDLDLSNRQGKCCSQGLQQRARLLYLQILKKNCNRVQPMSFDNGTFLASCIRRDLNNCCRIAWWLNNLQCSMQWRTQVPSIST